MLSKSLQRYLRVHRVATLGTVNKDKSIHLIPIVYANDASSIYFAIDKKPKRTQALRRLKNIGRNHSVTVLIDDYSEDWRKLSYVIIYAKAEILSSENSSKLRGIRLLKHKYSQYGTEKYLSENPRSTIIVRSTPSKIVRWSAKTRQHYKNGQIAS